MIRITFLENTNQEMRNLRIRHFEKSYFHNHKLLWFMSQSNENKTYPRALFPNEQLQFPVCKTISAQALLLGFPL